MTRTILFDLDGTLVDALPDIEVLTNALLADLGFPPHAREDYRRLVGWGTRELCRLALPEAARTESLIQTADAELRKRYAANPVSLSRPYPGMVEVLNTLVRRGCSLAVLSNKPDDITHLVVERLFPESPFARVAGSRDGVPRKPDPGAAREIARTLGVRPEECFFVGDSDVDMRTARNAGMTPVGVSWGYRSAEEIRAAGAGRILDRPEDLLELFL